MPLYEYRCRDCQGEFELLVRSAVVLMCPSCHGQDLERMLSLFAVSSEERSRSSLAVARRRYQQSQMRKDKVRHETEEVREHVQEDYGIDLGKKSGKPAG